MPVRKIVLFLFRGTPATMYSSHGITLRTQPASLGKGHRRQLELASTMMSRFNASPRTSVELPEESHTSSLASTLYVSILRARISPNSFRYIVLPGRKDLPQTPDKASGDRLFLSGN